MHALRLNSALAELLDLIIHQRDQSRDHGGELWRLEHCRQLIAETRALPRRKDREGILSLHDGADGLHLSRLKTVVAENLSESLRHSPLWVILEIHLVQRLICDEGD